MGAMLKDAVLRSGVGGTATAVLVGVAVLYLVIARWALRPASGSEFTRASRLPLGDEENEDER